ncbi:MAG: phosphoribosylanthranilate isomerase [Bacteroidota bacterium]
MKVKICCISSIEEAKLAINLGATALGLVGPMPSGPGIISNEEIANIAAQIPSFVDTFLLTSETKAEHIIAHHRMVSTTTIQLVDALENRQYEIIKQALPATKIVRVLHVLNETTIQEAIEIAPQVDALLLDSGNPNLKIKTLGGTGKTHDWQISRKIVEAVDLPVYLAGGLNAQNVAQAIQKVRPDGVDLCSGVRTDEKLDEAKLRQFINAVKNATS